MFTNTANAWHGSADPCHVPDGDPATRIFFTVSYVSDNHDSAQRLDNAREKAFFVPRPGDAPDPEKDAKRLLRANALTCAKMYRSGAN
jgi:hypothetical protein